MTEDSDEAPYADAAVYAFGIIEIEWNSIEHQLFLIFFMLSGAKISRAYAIFFSVVNHRARREMTEAVAKLALKSHPALMRDFKALMRRLRNAAQKRNEIVHTIWEWKNGLPVPSLPLNSVFEGKNLPNEFASRIGTLRNLSDDLGDYMLRLPRGKALLRRLDREQDHQRPASLPDNHRPKKKPRKRPQRSPRAG